MYLGIEIGGTKLQLGVGHGNSLQFERLERLPIDPQRGAEHILEQIERVARDLIGKYPIEAIGYGFGGPIDANTQSVIKSHHVHGWDGFALAGWSREAFRLPAAVANDADAAGLAEALLGAGREHNPVLYVTVGSGIGAGLIVDGRIYPGSGFGAAELGHLRPGLHADRPEVTVEGVASGWSIAASAQSLFVDQVTRPIEALRDGGPVRGREQVRQRLQEAEEEQEMAIADLRSRCDGDPDALTARIVAEAAAEGNPVAEHILEHAWQVLGWGLAQAITLLAPSRVVIGGGVSLVGEERMLRPLRKFVESYVFPPFAARYDIVPAQLGESVVVHGALLLAAGAL